MKTGLPLKWYLSPELHSIPCQKIVPDIDYANRLGDTDHEEMEVGGNIENVVQVKIQQFIITFVDLKTILKVWHLITPMSEFLF
jgi:hypothetical protein